MALYEFRVIDHDTLIRCDVCSVILEPDIDLLVCPVCELRKDLTTAMVNPVAKAILDARLRIASRPAEISKAEEEPEIPEPYVPPAARARREQ